MFSFLFRRSASAGKSAANQITGLVDPVSVISPKGMKLDVLYREITDVTRGFQQCQQQIQDKSFFEIAENLILLMESKLREIESITSRVEEMLSKAKKEYHEKQRELRVRQRQLFELVRTMDRVKKEAKWQSLQKKKAHKKYQTETQLMEEIRAERDGFSQRMMFVQNRIFICENQIEEGEENISGVKNARVELKFRHVEEVRMLQDAASAAKEEKERIEGSNEFDPTICYVDEDGLATLKDQSAFQRDKLRNATICLAEQKSQQSFLEGVVEILREKAAVYEGDVTSHLSAMGVVHISCSEKDLRKDEQIIQDPSHLALLPADDRESSMSLPGLEKFDKKKGAVGSSSEESFLSSDEDHSNVCPLVKIKLQERGATPSNINLVNRLRGMMHRKGSSGTAVD